MTRVLLAVDETQESVRAAEAAHSLFGDDAEYLALSVMDISEVAPPAASPYPAAWGFGFWPVPYGTVLPYRPGTATAGANRASSDPVTTYDGGGNGARAAQVAEDTGGTIIDEAEFAAEERAQQALTESGLPEAESLGSFGDPAEMIRVTATERSVDVIVIGNHDRGWLSRLLRPSTSRAVLKDAPAPVLLVS